MNKIEKLESLYLVVIPNNEKDRLDISVAVKTDTFDTIQINFDNITFERIPEASSAQRPSFSCPNEFLPVIKEILELLTTTPRRDINFRDLSGNIVEADHCVFSKGEHR